MAAAFIKQFAAQAAIGSPNGRECSHYLRYTAWLLLRRRFFFFFMLCPFLVYHSFLSFPMAAFFCL